MSVWLHIYDYILYMRRTGEQRTRCLCVCCIISINLKFSHSTFVVVVVNIVVVWASFYLLLFFSVTLYHFWHSYHFSHPLYLRLQGISHKSYFEWGKLSWRRLGPCVYTLYVTYIAKQHYKLCICTDERERRTDGQKCIYFWRPICHHSVLQI